MSVVGMGIKIELCRYETKGFGQCFSEHWASVIIACEHFFLGVYMGRNMGGTDAKMAGTQEGMG